MLRNNSLLSHSSVVDRTVGVNVRRYMCAGHIYEECVNSQITNVKLINSSRSLTFAQNSIVEECYCKNWVSSFSMIKNIL